MRTPLGRVRGLGSGKTGTDVFIRERVSGLLLFVLTPYLIAVLLPTIGAPYPVVLSHIGSIWVGIPLIAFLLINASHMAMGMRVIIEDYVHTHMLKYFLLILNWAFSWGCCLAATVAVLRIILLSQS